jgi:glucose 1-dehydrogenase
MSAGQGQQLAGQIALVTGSTRGIGRTIAEWLAREGATIIVSGREMDDVDDSVAAMQALGVESFGIAADTSDIAETHRLAEEAIRRAGKLDILVNNAGMSIRGNFWEVSDADWEYQTNVNYRSPYILSQHAARDMIAKQTRGRIVNISTIGAHRCHLDAAVYDSAKGAVETMTRNMAYELGPYGISVNCIAPGAIAERPGANPDPERLAKTAKYIPFGRVGRSDDIAAAVRFFCLPETTFTTGQVLVIDGAHGTWLPE